MDALSDVSERRVCRVFAVSRSAMWHRGTPQRTQRPQVDEVLAARLQRLIQAFPTFGYRLLWALLRFRDGVSVNRKAVYRVLKLKGWFVHQRRTTPRPRPRWLGSRLEHQRRFPMRGGASTHLHRMTAFGGKP